MYLKSGGFGLLAVKSRSVDITKRPKEVYSQVREELEKKVTIVDYRVLDPFEKDHAMFVVKK
jgi:fibrillarin-like pre-rRNA processing protein